MRNMSLKELFDLKEELQIAKDEEKGVSLPALIGVEEELLRRLSRDKDDENSDHLAKVQSDLINHLVYYGSYLKTVYKKDHLDDQKSLAKVLKYDRGNALAYYRLGIYAYQRKYYVTAAVHFNNALKSHERNPHSPYRLSAQQHYHTLLYLTNSSLKVATETGEETRKLKEQIEEKSLANLDVVPLHEHIRQNETYIENHAFIVISQSSVKMASKEECEEQITSEEMKPYLILYFSDQQQSVIFQKKEVLITVLQANVLKRFLLYSREGKLVTKKDVADLFASRDQSGEIAEDMYKQVLKRLKGKLAELDLAHTIIQQEEGDLYDTAIPFLCIQRTEEF
ncbi:hypothetical protein MUB24_09040 [Lederbergia sp. NSJ-179]|uniref:hypothetical protein n=1 Tax=Lederbergia sp. NSJ-179 TaxID=2931402 RepID=UPI001FD5EDDA|nr:hypothetical protein [Lederbergia sp. NSJ-179]MCJ7841043.1 hypothetical protein [Lederbergia sp. NSJ-179]